MEYPHPHNTYYQTITILRDIHRQWMPNYLGKFLYTVTGLFTSHKHILVGTFSNTQTQQLMQQTSLNSYQQSHNFSNFLNTKGRLF